MRAASTDTLGETQHEASDPHAARASMLIDDAVEAARGGRRARRALHAAIDKLVDLDGLDGPGARRVDALLDRRLATSVLACWERGWEPVELVHVARREADAGLVRLLGSVIAAELTRPDRADLVPARWRDQCGSLGVDLTPPATAATPPAPHAGAPSGGRLDGGRLDGGTRIELAVRLLARLTALPGLDPLGEPPSRWSLAAAGPAPAAGEVADAKLLSTIRALLAKAESTTFAAEAEAFTDKALELMRRHAIDAAALAGPGQGRRQPAGAVRMRRVPIEDPYGDEKAGLLAAVADLDDVRAVWDAELGLATLIGFPADLDAVELLFTSLLVQATSAVNDPANAAPERRAPSFRRAFLLAYTDRIVARLQRAGARAGREAQAAHGTAYLPALAARRAVVDAEADRLFPHTGSAGARLVDAAGWEAGRRAAERARLQP